MMGGRNDRGGTSVLLVGGFSILYFALTGRLAAERPLWYDELFTLHLGDLPSLADVRAVLATGVEQTELLFHAVTRGVIAVLGDGRLALRLPEILGVWVLCLCLYRFVSRRTSPLAGGAAMLFPLLTFARFYATDARPYGLALGLAGLALVAWQRATEGEGRPLALAGLAASLGAAGALHAYAVLLWVPLVAAELARARGRGRPDGPVWVALGVGLVPLLVSLPLLWRGRVLAATFWAKPTWPAIVTFYPDALAGASVALVALLALAAVAARRPANRPPAPPPPAHEVVLAMAFLALPAAAVVLGKAVTGVFTLRYAIWTIIGIALLFGWAVTRLLDGRRILGGILIVVLAGSLVVEGALAIGKARAQSRLLDETWQFLRDEADPESPLVIAHPHQFLQLAHYAPPEVARRLVYLADPAASVRYIGQDTSERALLELRRWVPVRVEPYAEFLTATPWLLVYVRDGDARWLLSALAGEHVELRARRSPHTLFQVRRVRPLAAPSTPDPSG